MRKIRFRGCIGGDFARVFLSGTKGSYQSTAVSPTGERTMSARAFQNFLEKMFELGILFIAAEAETDRPVKPSEVACTFILVPPL
jgi:hypothetical protein